jgi:hypothetical protein
VSQFGREMVVLSPGHQHSRAYLEADKLFTERKKSLPCLLEEGVITITPQEENYE